MKRNDKVTAGRFYIDNIAPSKGVEANNFLHSLSFSINIYRVNSLELMESIKLTENEEFMLEAFKIENKSSVDQINRELNRLSHNYLSSVATFADHVRVKMDEKYIGTDFFRSYKEFLNSEFSTNKHSRFVRDLRNYMVHRCLPDSNVYINFSNSGEKTEEGEVLAEIETGAYFGRSQFLEWKKWSSKAKDWLTEQDEKIKLRLIFEPHIAKMEKFVDWFEVAFRNHHHNDYLEYEDLVKKYSDLDAQ